MDVQDSDGCPEYAQSTRVSEASVELLHFRNCYDFLAQ
jgi:hypothetical protein